MLTVNNLTRGQKKKSRTSASDDGISMKSSISASTAISMRSRYEGPNTWSIVRKQLSLNGKAGFYDPPSTRMSLRRQGSIGYGKHPAATSMANAVTKLQNTYKMSPDRDAYFRPMLVEKEVKIIMERVLEDEVYVPEHGGRLTEILTEAVKARVKELGCKRLKLIAQVVLGSKSGQSMEMASRCVWNEDTDNFVSVCYENVTIFAVANIFAVYFD